MLIDLKDIEWVYSKLSELKSTGTDEVRNLLKTWSTDYPENPECKRIFENLVNKITSLEDEWEKVRDQLLPLISDTGTSTEYVYTILKSSTVETNSILETFHDPLKALELPLDAKQSTYSFACIELHPAIKRCNVDNKFGSKILINTEVTQYSHIKTLRDEVLKHSLFDIDHKTFIQFETRHSLEYFKLKPNNTLPLRTKRYVILGPRKYVKLTGTYEGNKQRTIILFGGDFHGRFCAKEQNNSHVKVISVVDYVLKTIQDSPSTNFRNSKDVTFHLFTDKTNVLGTFFDSCRLEKRIQVHNSDYYEYSRPKIFAFLNNFELLLTEKNFKELQDDYKKVMTDKVRIALTQKKSLLHKLQTLNYFMTNNTYYDDPLFHSIVNAVTTEFESDCNSPDVMNIEEYLQVLDKIFNETKERTYDLYKDAMRYKKPINIYLYCNTILVLYRMLKRDETNGYSKKYLMYYSGVEEVQLMKRLLLSNSIHSYNLTCEKQARTNTDFVVVHSDDTMYKTPVKQIDDRTFMLDLHDRRLLYIQKDMKKERQFAGTFDSVVTELNNITLNGWPLFWSQDGDNDYDSISGTPQFIEGVLYNDPKVIKFLQEWASAKTFNLEYEDYHKENALILLPKPSETVSISNWFKSQSMQCGENDFLLSTHESERLKDIIDKKYVYFCLEDCNFNCDDLWTELHWTLRSGML